MQRKFLMSPAWLLATVVCLAGSSACNPPVAQSPPALQPANVAPSSLQSAEQPKTPAVPDASEVLFARRTIPEIKIKLDQNEEQKLRSDQRRFAQCTLIENGETTYPKVAVKLKGAAGSFRDLDDKPAFTLKLKKQGERFHGLQKFHLNNSVQDESYLCELLGSELFREAGYPAARVTHARVWLNDRDLGFYVLKEGFDETFLKRHFRSAEGNLYDGGFCIDIDAELEKDAGAGPDDRSDLQALAAACREEDENQRAQRIAEKLDVDLFLDFAALELLLGHWDGYVPNKNNYRIYFRGDDDKAVFLPHGMDQIFQDAGFPCFQDWGQIVAGPVLRNPQWQAKYRRRVKEFLPLLEREKLHGWIDAEHVRMRPTLAALGKDAAQHFDESIEGLKSRVADRAQHVREQLSHAPAEPLLFDDNKPLLIEGWQPRRDGDAFLEEQMFEGEECYVIEVGPNHHTTSSWRRRVLLGRGSYELQAQGRVTNVMAIDGDPHQGLGLRISGGGRENRLVGTTGWKPLTYAFEVRENAQEVELVAELRSTSGNGAFQRGSLRLMKAK